MRKLADFIQHITAIFMCVNVAQSNFNCECSEGNVTGSIQATKWEWILIVQAYKEVFGKQTEVV